MGFSEFTPTNMRIQLIPTSMRIQFTPTNMRILVGDIENPLGVNSIILIAKKSIYNFMK